MTSQKKRMPEECGQYLVSCPIPFCHSRSWEKQSRALLAFQHDPNGLCYFDGILYTLTENRELISPHESYHSYTQLVQNSFSMHISDMCTFFFFIMFIVQFAEYLHFRKRKKNYWYTFSSCHSCSWHTGKSMICKMKEIYS